MITAVSRFNMIQSWFNRFGCHLPSLHPRWHSLGPCEFQRPWSSESCRGGPVPRAAAGEGGMGRWCHGFLHIPGMCTGCYRGYMGYIGLDPWKVRSFRFFWHGMFPAVSCGGFWLHPLWCPEGAPLQVLYVGTSIYIYTQEVKRRSFTRSFVKDDGYLSRSRSRLITPDHAWCWSMNLNTHIFFTDRGAHGFVYWVWHCASSTSSSANLHISKWIFPLSCVKLSLPPTLPNPLHLRREMYGETWGWVLRYFM